MSTPSGDGRRAGRWVSPWVRQFVAEIARSRHVILHGNIHDMVRWQGGFVPLSTALGSILSALSYDLVGRYDQVDGLVFDGEHGHRRFAELIDAPTPEADPADRPPQEQPVDPPDAADDSRGARARELQRRMRSNLREGAAEAPRYRQPSEALAAVRRGLAQESRPVAFILDFAELLLLDPAHHDRQDRDLLLLTKKMMLESGRAAGAQVHNLLVVVVPDLASVPPWLHRDEPFVRAVEVPLPSYRERQGYLATIAGGFYGHGGAGQEETAAAVRTLANLTDGMALAELNGLAQTSRVEKVPLSEPRELIKRALFGQQDDPWVRLVDRVPHAERQLGERVIGQHTAVRAVSRALAAGTLNVDFVSDPYSVEARPKGVFFFAGPTGVGKTELARALSEMIFEDETALTRFDMSTFAMEHAAERFTGAPPGYVGHERGGELTNRVMSRPFSVLLFDEIEKSHESVFDKFLQILEDGRLTDGLGRTAYFSQSLIIFTSNLGATPLYSLLQKGELPSYEEVSELFQHEVSEHFATTLKRPELLGRIGNGVLAFDVLRPENIPAITAKFLRQITASAARAGIDLELDQESITAGVARQMRNPRSLALGGREIRNILDRSVRAPLIDCVVATGRRTGRFHVELPQDRSVAVVSPRS